MKIDRAGNGYILTKENGLKAVHLILESVFSYMLLYFEGRGKYFKDNSYGDVEIHRAPGETHKGGDVIMPVKVKAKKAVTLKIFALGYKLTKEAGLNVVHFFVVMMNVIMKTVLYCFGCGILR